MDMVLGKAFKVLKAVNTVRKIVTLLAVIGVIGGGAFYLNGVQDIGVVDKQFNGFSGVDTTGFDMDFQATISNPSRLPITISTVDYKVFLEENGQLLAEGSLKGIEIRPQTNTTLEAKPHVSFTGSGSVLLQYLTQDEVPAEVQISAELLPGLPAVSFTHTVDLKPAIEQAQDEAGGDLVGAVDDAEDAVGDVTREDSGDSAGGVVDNVSDDLPV